MRSINAVLIALFKLNVWILLTSPLIVRSTVAWENASDSASPTNVNVEGWKKCSSQTDCDGCYGASVACHWCSDGKCHFRGGLFGVGGGCTVGKTCERKANYTDSEKKLNALCASRTDCAGCGAASKDCRWCADKKCHAAGSVYGCVVPEACPHDHGHHHKGAHNLQCSRHTDCASCRASPDDCNWCGRDNKCHGKGIFLGCEYSETCVGATNRTIETMDDECRRHETCTECFLSSGRCHFCAFDNKCHAKGSVHGCPIGTECYKKNTCVRQKPETNPQVVRDHEKKYEGEGIDDVLFYASVVLGILLGSSIFFVCRFIAVWNSWKEKYVDDSFSTELTSMLDNDGHNERTDHRINSSTPLLNNDIENRTEVTCERSSDESNDTLPTDVASVDTQLADNTTTSREKIRTPVPKSVVGLGILCLLTIFFTLIVIVLMCVYYPLYPVAVVCDTSLSAKQIVAARSQHMILSFQLVASVYNPNKLNVKLVRASANAYHRNEYLGRITIPSVQTLEGSAVTDVVLSATASLTRLEALHMYGEYNRGRVEINANIDTEIEIPALLGGFGYRLRLNNYTYVFHKPTKNHKKDGGSKELCRCNSTSKELFSALFDLILEPEQVASMIQY